MSRNLQAIHKE